MIVSIRELNEYGNVLQKQGAHKQAESIHAQVRSMMKRGETKMNVPEDTPQDLRLYRNIKKAKYILKN